MKIEINVSVAQLNEMLSVIEGVFDGGMKSPSDKPVRGEAFAAAVEKDGCGELASSVHLLLPVYRGLLRYWKRQGTPAATVLIDDPVSVG